MKVIVCKQWKESNVRESVLRLIERCKDCGVSYMPANGEVCNCSEEPVVKEWEDKNKFGWRKGVELVNVETE